ncbi:MAG: hypothetical protein QM572_15940 [Nocardioides sp.]|uniref:hypothetical protein n=1 Tax=Nocardioides sp. TaxID=35761 RepID=UPI0039E6E61C
MSEGTQGEQGHQHGHEPVGSAAEEAARLFATLTDWAQGQVAEASEHFANGSPECTYCPICRTVHAVREVSPEVRDHLATAAASLMQAVAGLLTSVATPARTPERGPTVQRIDLDDIENDWPDA